MEFPKFAVSLIVCYSDFVWSNEVYSLFAANHTDAARIAQEELGNGEWLGGVKPVHVFTVGVIEEL